jgi:dTDP-4-dehydrorhamnose reductase
MKSVAIIGPNGQLGTDLIKSFKNAGWNAHPVTHEEIQIENIDSVRKSLNRYSLDWIINTAAFHKVDECEKDSERAWQINAYGAANVSRIANELGAKSVFISSDYVFSGTKQAGDSYAESDRVSPVNTYGHSKAGGEASTLSANPNNLVIRISSVFGAAGSSGKGGNFVETILSKAKMGSPLKIVNDVNMSPTYTVDASNLILCALSSNQSGILHASNTGSATWFDFGKAILELSGIETDIIAIETNFEISPKRPKNSTLNTCAALKLLPSHPDWGSGLERYLKEKGHI